MKKFHEIANLFPLLDEESPEFKDMVTTIGKSGLLEKITLLNGEILDGRNRARACEKAGVEPTYEDYTDSDPFGFVASKNLHRRHLTPAQRAFIARKMAVMKHGGDRVSEQASNSTLARTTVAEAAKNLGISTTSLRLARRIEKAGIPEVAEAAKAGKITLNAAEVISKLPKTEQAQALEKAAVAKGKKKPSPKPEEPVMVAPVQPKSNGRLSPTKVAEHEARINAPSIYPEDLPLPVHPKAHLSAHIQEAITDLKKHEPRIGELSRRWCYQEVWCLTQRIQSYAPGHGKPADQVVDIHPRWVEWARSVAGKVRARESLLLDGPQNPQQDSQNGAPKKRKFSDAGFEKQIKEWRSVLKRALKEILFAPDEASRVLQAAEQIILTYFEERRTTHVRLTPSSTGEPDKHANLGSIERFSIAQQRALEK